MQNFQDTFETCKQSFISASSIYMTVTLKDVALQMFDRCRIKDAYYM